MEREDRILETAGIDLLDEPAVPPTKEHPFLEGLTAHQHRILSDCAIQSHFETGMMLFREGDPANSFYMLQNGKVALECHTQTGTLALIHTLGAGDVLGWSWLFPPHFWHFSARVLEPADALHIHASILRDECDVDHELGYELTKRLALVMLKRLDTARRQLIELRALQ